MAGSHRRSERRGPNASPRRTLGQWLRLPFTSFGRWAVERSKKLTIFLVGAQAGVGAAIKFATDPVLVVGLVALLIVLSISVGLLGAAKIKRIEEERIEASTETRVAIVDSLEPTMVALGKMLNGNLAHRRNEASGMCMTVLSAAVGLAPSDARPRACYFKLNDAGDCMEFSGYSGRVVEPKAEFRLGTTEGNAAFEMVQANQIRFCDDVSENPPPGWKPSDRGEYVTFIAVPVKSASTVFGMLTLDAVTIGSITQEDAQVLRVLGVVLGIAEQESPQTAGRRSQKPRVGPDGYNKD